MNEACLLKLLFAVRDYAAWMDGNRPDSQRLNPRALKDLDVEIAILQPRRTS